MMLGTLVKACSPLGYSLRALHNKYKLLTRQIARQWPELNATAHDPRRWARMVCNGWVWIALVSCNGAYISQCWGPTAFGCGGYAAELVAGQFPALLLLGRDESLRLCDLSSHSPGCSLVLDRPIWFKREGGWC
jgi:hypothetical protein